MRSTTIRASALFRDCLSTLHWSHGGHGVGVPVLRSAARAGVDVATVATRNVPHGKSRTRGFSEWRVPTRSYTQKAGAEGTPLTPSQVAGRLQVSVAWVRDHSTRKHPRLSCASVATPAYDAEHDVSACTSRSCRRAYALRSRRWIKTCAAAGGPERSRKAAYSEQFPRTATQLHTRFRSAKNAVLGSL